ncbi:DUF1499 domain-containing protein [Salipaludibacillus daqingensis]|uniref:DUF1499 domain-containing protein n=1 Tax=Salipaludibacillus daqingensis TaxID=3041001 RepID=UPI00247470AF|nr:DUF1499 domain-containing protein [Salipaludibacillus daqingensis]
MRIFLTIFVSLIAIVAIFMFSKNSTAPKHLGVNDGHLSELPSSPNAVSTQTSIDEKRVDPFPFKDGDLKTSYSLIEKILNSEEQAEIVEKTDNYIHAVFTSPTMRYKDDVEFYFDTNNQRVDYRSASRIGYSDMGANQQRYERIRESYLQ